jgi:hypothetical protein
MRVRLWIQDEPLSPDADKGPTIYVDWDVLTDKPLPWLRYWSIAAMQDLTGKLSEGEATPPWVAKPEPTP